LCCRLRVGSGVCVCARAVGACVFETEHACSCRHTHKRDTTRHEGESTHLEERERGADPLNPCPKGLALAPAGLAGMRARVRVCACDWLLTRARGSTIDTMRLIAHQLTARLGDTRTSAPACRSSLATSPRPLPAYRIARSISGGRTRRRFCTQRPAGTCVVCRALHTAHASLRDAAR
jgi:hypothetical protein